MRSFPYLVLLSRPGGAYASVCLGVYMATPCFPVSGDVGDLESQTIPIGLWPYPPRPWTWLLGLGMRVSSVSTLIVAAIPGLSQERCCETTRADFSVAWVPPASPLPSSAARVCLGKGRISCETMTLASLRPSWTCHSPSRSRVAILFHRFMSVPHRHILRCCEHPFTTGGAITHP